ncbi:hypothetical protein AB0M34_35485 [Nocardia sp. NPDC050193]
MTSPLHIERVQEQGMSNDAGVPISESEYIGFTPGNRNIDTYDEVYGDDITVHCDREPAQVGESAKCSLSFDAPAD